MSREILLIYHRFFNFFLDKYLTLGYTINRINERRIEMGLGQRNRRPLTPSEIAAAEAAREAADARYDEAQASHAELATEAAEHGFGEEIQRLGIRALKQLKAAGWEMTPDLAEEFFE
jgi:hypothetical protein